MNQFQSALAAITAGNLWLVGLSSAAVMLLVGSVSFWMHDQLRLLAGSAAAILMLLGSAPMADRIAGVPAAVEAGCAAVAHDRSTGNGQWLSREWAVVEQVCGRDAAGQSNRIVQ